MKKLLLILLCLPMIGFGQGWEQTYGGQDVDEGIIVEQTNDGGYIVLGNTKSFGNGFQDIWIVKIDNLGNEEWSQTYGGSSNDAGNFIQETSDSGFIIIGDFDNESWIKRLDKYGNNVFFNYLGSANSSGSSVKQVSDGGFVIGLYTGLMSIGNTVIRKINEIGYSEWTHQFVTPDYADYSINGNFNLTYDGGYIFTGAKRVIANGPYNVLLLKLDSIDIPSSPSNQAWETVISVPNLSYGKIVQQTIDSGFVVLGNPYSSKYEICLIKTDSQGNQLWIQSYSDPINGLQGNYFQQTLDGGFIIIGTEIKQVDNDLLIIKVNPQGFQEWQKIFSGISYDEGSYIQQTSDGGYIITGSTVMPGNGSDMWLIKTDNQGNITSTFTIPINPNRKLLNTVDILGKQTKPQTNIPFIEIYDDGTVEKRIVIE